MSANVSEKCKCRFICKGCANILDVQHLHESLTAQYELTLSTFLWQVVGRKIRIVTLM